MSNPGGSSGLVPGQWGVTGTDGSIPQKATHSQANVTQTLQDQFSSNQFSGLGGALIAMIISFIGAAIGAVLGGFASVIDAIFGTVDNHYVSQIPIITNHTASITTLQAQFNQLILQGNAIVFTSNNTYTPTAGIKSIDVIIIGAGGGGSSGSYDFVTYGPQSGGGGGGGGEVHTNIPASLLPQSGGVFSPITITIGAGGAGGASDQAVGVGGGNTIFGSGTTSLTAGGGNGGAWGHPAPSTSGLGGVGMILGGNGGIGSYIPNGGTYLSPTAPSIASVSAYDLHGGGGGGGAGSGKSNDGSAGGAGGISPGGAFAVNAAGNPGAAPSSIVATGGGGGAGGGGGYGGSGHFAGGAGAFPAGGGGGAACDGSGGGAAGAGGNGILYIIEHSS